uniref:Reverse transcriptase Ty1/copia-type domain-containing protein n=1 Tax=Peronospora matthiolae TaxID=2874970 RepID=A0AAV1UEK1_9STRA
MNRTLVECARCMMEHAGLVKSYWGEAVMTAMFLRNLCPTRAIHYDKSPYQVWTMKKPIMANLKVFGYHAYVQVPQDRRAKFDSTSSLFRFLGYAEHQKSYRFEEVSTGAIKISRDATFMEDKFDEGPRNYNDESSTVEFDDQDDDEEKEEGKTDVDMNSSDDDDEDTRSSKSNIKRHTRTQSLEKAIVIPSPKRRTYRGPSLEHVSAAAMDFEAAYIMDSVGEMPTTFKSAMESSDSGKWKEVCDSEFDSFQINDTWEIVPHPKGRKAIGCRWVFCTKENQDGEFERFKARLVAKGLSKKFGVDYEETFAPVAKFTSIRVVLSVAAKYGLMLHQMDVKTTFLNGSLDEDIYMDQPAGYLDEKQPDYVCKLKRSL